MERISIPIEREDRAYNIPIKQPYTVTSLEDTASMLEARASRLGIRDQTDKQEKKYLSRQASRLRNLSKRSPQ